jgi:hypothetical protein
MYLLLNFNHERFVISASTCRFARLCYAEALSLGAGGKKRWWCLGISLSPYLLGISSSPRQDRIGISYWSILDFFTYIYIYNHNITTIIIILIIIILIIILIMIIIIIISRNPMFDRGSNGNPNGSPIRTMIYIHGGFSISMLMY